MDVFAHRGLTTIHPPNSIGAFSDALESGFDLEVDLRITADETLVVHHDPIILTDDGTQINIRSNVVDGLQSALQAAPDPRETLVTITNLFEVYTQCATGNHRIALHLKDYERDRAAEILVSALRELDDKYPDCDPLEQCLVFDTPAETARRVKQLAPALEVALSVGDAGSFPRDSYPTLHSYDDLETLTCWDVAWADEWGGHNYQPDQFDRVRERGRRIYAISPELHEPPDSDNREPLPYQEVWKHLRAFGIDGLCTDNPREAVSFFEA